MWHSVVNYLSDPKLVVETQKIFGVNYVKLKHVNDSLPNCDGLSLPNDSKQKSLHKIENVNFQNNHKTFHNLEKQETQCIITNKFWFYIFLICTALGDEIFYASFIPFWFWNIDGAVGRRMVMVWATVMYIGQGVKDIVRMPRPGPPVQKLQTKWAIEYGMPSTHAMAGVSMSFSILIFTLDRYQYSFWLGLFSSIFLCTMICISRVYLGMHSILDIFSGLLLAALLMVPLIPAIDSLDIIILTNKWSPIFVLTISILVIWYYPNSDKWTPTRGDTTVVVSVCAGIQIGAWCNYQLGYMKFSDDPPPYKIIWPSYDMLGLAILRTVIGICGIVATRAIAKFFSYAFICALLGRDKNELRNSPDNLQNKDKILVDLCYKYFTYCMIGFNILFLLPNVFKLMGIERPTFNTEL